MKRIITALIGLVPAVGLVVAAARKPLSAVTEVAHVVSETANMTLHNAAPYVGHSAFAHKDGLHVSAMREEVAPFFAPRLNHAGTARLRGRRRGPGGHAIRGCNLDNGHV